MAFESAEKIWGNGLTLRRWRLSNFKSVRMADVELAPLTVVVGANSAGKSTLLQSIRAVVQAVSIAGTAFPLNGDQVRLGTFEETLWSGALNHADAEVSLGGVFHLGDNFGRPSSYGMRRTSVERAVPTWRSRMGGALDLDWSIALRGQPPGQPALTWLTRTFAEASAPDGSRCKVQAVAVVATNGVQSTTSTFSGTVETTGHHSQPVSDVHVVGGFPVRAVGRRSLIPRLIDAWLDVARDAALERINRKEGRPTKTTDIATLADLIASDIRTLLSNYSELEIFSVAFERRERLEIRQLASEREFVDFSLAAQDLARLIRAVENKVGRTLYGDRLVQLPEMINETTHQAREFLASRVQHLGPLRMDPQVVYTSAPLSRSGYIGDKGEYTAAVLQANGGDVVHVSMPPGSGLSRMPTTLSSAVNAWAAYLGIGEAFSTTDQGRIGLRLEVEQQDVNMRLDLTSVGTGVSQLLPVLVMCLQAPQGSLLLIEQPELHLNPAVQQRLGDFLLAIANSGRQLIVETHSDYLINRLRLHAIADRTNTVSRRIAVVFAERQDGETVYTAAHPSVDGSLEEWPQGFFDEASQESERILRAMVERARR